MQTKYLSEKERGKGQHHFALYELWNGVSIGLLGDTLVYVLAVYFSANAFELGYISSALYITALVVPFVAPLLVGKNINRIMTVSWYLRGFLCIGHLLLLFTSGRLAVFVLLVVYSLYAALRAVGMTMYDAISKSITTIRNRGAFYAKANICYNFSTLVTKLFAVFVMQFSPLSSLYTIIILQMIGIVGNTIASYEVSKVPCRITFDYSKDSSFKEGLKLIFKNKKMAFRVFIRFLQVTVIVMMGMNVPFMSTKLHLSDSAVMLFTVEAMLAYVLSGVVVQALSDKMGSKPLIISSSILFIFSSLCWAFFPVTLGALPFFIVGFFTSFSMQLVYLLSTKMTADVIPENGAGSFTVIVNVGMAMFSLVGALLAGELVNLGETSAIGKVPYVINDYSICFFAASILSFGVLLLSIFMKEEGAQKTKTLFSREGLQAVSTISRLESQADPLLRRRLVMDLSENSAIIAKDEIRAKLHSPYSRDARDIIKTLTLKKDDYFVSDLVELAKNDDSYVQTDAILALSSYKNSVMAYDALVYIMKNSLWSSARSIASRSLSYFDNSSEYLPLVEEAFSKSIHIDVVVDYLVALYNMDKDKKICSRIFDYTLKGKSVYFRSTLYAFFDTLISDETPRLARLYEFISLGTPVEDAISNFLEDLKDVYIIDEKFDSIIDAFRSHDKEKERSIILEIVKNSDVNGAKDSVKPALLSLKEGLLKTEEMPLKNFDNTDMVALLYFASLLSSPDSFLFS